jgi:coproporphyrinogen III oxidase-like Fe-S oxidoreductase
VKSGADPMEGCERLSPENRIAESVYLGLRSRVGLMTDPSDRRVIAPWVDAGWATLTADGRLRCTPAGWLRLDALAAALTHHRSR